MHIKCYSQQHIAPTHKLLLEPLQPVMIKAPPLRSRSNKPLAMNTGELLSILTCYHLQDFSSGRELLQTLEEDDYTRQFVAPAAGVKRSTFFDTVNDRGVEQLLFVFTELQKQAAGALPSQHSELGDLVAIDGSFAGHMLGKLQYGNGIKAFVIYLIISQMVALNRVQKQVSAMIGAVISEASLLKFVWHLHQSLEQWEAEAIESILHAPSVHVDETSDWGFFRLFSLNKRGGDTKKKALTRKNLIRAFTRNRRRPTLPHSCPCSTIGAKELNFRVRNGNGWILLAITTDKSVKIIVTSRAWYII